MRKFASHPTTLVAAVLLFVFSLAFAVGGYTPGEFMGKLQDLFVMIPYWLRTGLLLVLLLATAVSLKDDQEYGSIGHLVFSQMVVGFRYLLVSSITIVILTMFIDDIPEDNYNLAVSAFAFVMLLFDMLIRATQQSE